MKMDGQSFAATLQGNEQPGHEDLFFHHAKGKAIRKGNWKLVAERKKDWELYDLGKDPLELNDLSKAMPEKVEQLRKAWKEWGDELQNRAER